MSEYELGLQFEQYLNNNIQSHFNFNCLFKEIESLQGIPDYIGVHIKDASPAKGIDNISPDNWSTSYRILACLKRNQYHTLKYLKKNTGLSEQRLTKELISLCRKKIILQNKHGSYKLSEQLYIPEMNIYSFELKLSNWKRALFQAMRYKTFSEYTYIVMPSEKKTLLIKNLNIFKENNIGIILFDTTTCSIEIIYNPRKNKGVSKIHSYYIKGKLLLEKNESKHVSGSL